jgi:hypothetical protein
MSASASRPELIHATVAGFTSSSQSVKNTPTMSAIAVAGAPISSAPLIATTPS